MPDRVRTLTGDRFWSDNEVGIFVQRLPAHGDNQAHDHVFHEIVYVEAGAADHVSAGETHRLRPGDVIVIRPQIWHEYRNARGLTIINCLFDARVIQRFAPLLAKVDGAVELFRRPVRRPAEESPVVLHVRPAQRPALLERFERMMAEEHDRTSGWEAAAAACLLDVLVATARLSREQLKDAPTAPRLTGRTDQAVLDTVSHLETSFAQPISLGDLSARVRVSPAHLSRSFARRMGMGVVEFVHRLRCEEACRLLRWTPEPIGHIGTRVGYDEIAYFSRCFRQQIGQSPREYRRAWNGSKELVRP